MNEWINERNKNIWHTEWMNELEYILNQNFFTIFIISVIG